MINVEYLLAVNVYNGRQKIVAIRGNLTDVKLKKYKNLVANGPQTVECYVQFSSQSNNVWFPVDIHDRLVRLTGDGIQV